MNRNKLTGGQIIVLALAGLPMLAAGVAGGIASYFNFRDILSSASNALSLVIAGEGATFICAVVALAVTLMGQHTPAVVRLGLWVLPGVAAVAGAIVAPDVNTKVVMALAPLGMTAAGEGLALVARRIVAYRSDVDLEAQRRAGLLVWHAGRAQNGNWFQRRASKAAVWRLTKAFAAADAQMAVQVDDIQRYRIGENLDVNLTDVLAGVGSKRPERPAVAPAEAAPALPPAAQPEAATQALAASTNGPAVMAAQPVTLDDAHHAAVASADGSWEAMFAEVMDDAQQTVLADPLVKLLTVAEVAAQKKVATGTVRSWIHRGKLRVHDRDVDGRALIHPDDLARMD